MSEPLWRKVLCWGAVVSFFMLPLIAFLVVTGSVVFREGLSPREIDSFKAFSGYQATLGALVFGLAGLNTWDKKTANGK